MSHLSVDVQRGSRGQDDPHVFIGLSLCLSAPAVCLSGNTFTPWECLAQQDPIHHCQVEVADWSSGGELYTKTISFFTLSG